MSLEHLVAPESNKILKRKKIENTHNDEDMWKSNEINKVVFSYNPKYKIHIHKSTLMNINIKSIMGRTDKYPTQNNSKYFMYTHCSREVEYNSHSLSMEVFTLSSAFLLKSTV